MYRSGYKARATISYTLSLALCLSVKNYLNILPGTMILSCREKKVPEARGLPLFCLHIIGRVTVLLWFITCKMKGMRKFTGQVALCLGVLWVCAVAWALAENGCAPSSCDVRSPGLHQNLSLCAILLLLPPPLRICLGRWCQLWILLQSLFGMPFPSWLS